MPDLASPLILGMGGTPQSGSTTERALAVALKAASAEGAETLMIAGPALVLPMYAGCHGPVDHASPGVGALSGSSRCVLR
jgi:FMN reductase